MLTPDIEKNENKTIVATAAYNELYARLVYEYLFDIISCEYIFDGTWMNEKLRDKGHQTQMMKLYRLSLQ